MRDSIELEAALDAMYHSVLAADFEFLSKIAEETERLLGRLDVLRDKAIAGRLREKANRNGHCLQAAARGLRAAQRRLAEMANAEAGLATYTRQGARAQVGTGPGTLAQRL